MEKMKVQAMIESLKAQGFELPDPGEKKTRPGTRIRPNKSKSSTTQPSCKRSNYLRMRLVFQVLSKIRFEEFIFHLIEF